MKQVLNKKLLFISLIFSGFFWANLTKAVCPVCVVAIGAGLELSRWLGVDDAVSSIWIGGLLVAIIIWTLVWMGKKNWRFKFDTVIISLAYYLLVFVPLYYYEMIGGPFHKIFEIDKIIFGSAIGTVIFLFANWFNLYLKKRNGGKVFFPYQKVVIPLVFLLLSSLVLYLLILWRII